MSSPANRGKKQRSISSFFTPATPKDNPLPKPESPKRKLLQSFSHLPSKKAKSRTPEPPQGTSVLTPIESELLVDVDDTTPPSLRNTPPKKAILERKTGGSKKSPANTKLTPLEQQFKDLKRSNQDKVLAIQVGYKYKFFGHDAVIAAQVLNIMLIPGNKDLDERSYDRYAYCSIPDVRLHIHLKRLLEYGLKVGVVKQTETASIKSIESSNKSSLFERSITAVYTKATYMNEECHTATLSFSLLSDKPEYIMCIDMNGKETALVAVQPTSGDIVYDIFADSKAMTELESRLAYMRPCEAIILSDSVPTDLKSLLKLHNQSVSISAKPRQFQDDVVKNLAALFQTLGPDNEFAHLTDYYSLQYPPPISRCVSELMDYLAEFGLGSIFTLTENINLFTESGKFLNLPANVIKALDLFEVSDSPSSRTGSLLWLLDHTYTRKGLEMLQSWIAKPLLEKKDIEDRLTAVETLTSSEFIHIFDALKSHIAKLGKSGLDLNRSLIKVHYSATQNTEKISRKDVYLMLKAFNEICEVFRDFGSKCLDDFNAKFPGNDLLSQLIHEMLELSSNTFLADLVSQIDAGAAFEDSDITEQKKKFFSINKSAKFSAIATELDNIRDIDERLDEQLAEIRKFLKRPQISYVSVLKDTHLIEIRNGKQIDSLPPDWVKINATKSVSRFRPPEVQKLHKKLNYHSDLLLRACDQCFSLFLKEIDSHYVKLRSIVHHIAHFDCLLSLSKVVDRHGAEAYKKPCIFDEQVIDITDGVHPILLALPGNTNNYVPNNVQISYTENRVLIITGPNMGGKSSYVKQIALYVIMAQIGCFLPCSSAKIGIFDGLYIRMGASDNILRGQSTFMVEMLECSEIISHYTSKSLVILDEIGRGTGTVDGISLAYSILKYIIEDANGPLALFITHYPSLHVLELQNKAVKNYHMAFLEKTNEEGENSDWPEVIFLYKLVRGVVSNLYGLNVAKLAGIHTKIIDQAYCVAEQMRNSVENQEFLKKLASLSPSNASSVLASLAHIEM